MKDATKQERELARRLIIQEAGGNQSALGLVLGTERVLNGLYRHLVDLIGMIGFDALAKRALHLAAQECPFLASITTDTKPDQFRLQGLEAIVIRQDAAEVDGALVAIVGYFFWLLVTFVGVNLFERLIQGVWPNIKTWDNKPGSEGTEG